MRYIVDGGSELPIMSTVCSRCVHLTSVGTRACEAFPEGIPAVIWTGENDHHAPFPGDHGIQFEARQRTSPEPASVR
jgi:hypothetical protein